MNQSVIRALKLLDLFTGEQAELSLSQIAKKVNLSKPTVYRLLTSLEMCGFLVKKKYTDQDIRYRLGLKLLELGTIVSEQLELRKIALPHMEQLCQEIEEIVHLVIADGDQAVYIEKVETNQDLRLYTRVGKRSPFYVGSGPKLLLAYMPEEERNKILKHIKFQPFTANTITSLEELEQEINTIRRNGFAVSRGEQDLGTVGLSFPIRDHTGKVVAALGVSGLSMRFTGEREAFIKEKTQQAAVQISTELGYKPHV
ncbi:transcriptional regulator, IclR family [Caldalkalibacillus thermarum TA2.A1]|uniref:IclR family transcriptional regulator n=1 Tax=Caldalkalibacillus thermarum (strain TA2.A1) TaxID=986075 RepID=F5L610_CALTT|nr:IclR family transcriptional regulator [Caldalkalibacillus thermarum]EGL83213.1 transcriptional regulator, IclR family [Caldalkalibacillus thermarum TA2.A1]QZT34818.1 IclR family transcriptional regulator [Caldalkalibacillus thermarum TA2.A1]